MSASLLLLCALAGAPAPAQDDLAQDDPGQDDPGQDDLAPAAEGAAPQALEAPPARAPLTDDDEIDDVTEHVSKGLRCPVCQGLSVADSPSDGARTMKARIRELVAMGYSQEQIEDYFVDRYGDWIKLEPPTRGRHVLVWGLPVAFVLFGGGLVAWYVQANIGVRSRRAEVTPVEDDELSPYRARILAELGLDGGEA
ncbi:MAG: cytochrome c-type biogenesis protein CcmH [Alphaproteobacteria bacterium]|nr:cytochrome c-type biogenesis protein CcmH [Alphaproteobacteria bacterium]